MLEIPAEMTEFNHINVAREFTVNPLMSVAPYGFLHCFPQRLRTKIRCSMHWTTRPKVQHFLGRWISFRLIGACSQT